jgi:hypothetical protein
MDVELCLAILEAQDELFVGYHARYKTMLEEKKAQRVEQRSASSTLTTAATVGPLAALVAETKVIAAPRLVKACLEDSGDVVCVLLSFGLFTRIGWFSRVL